MSEKEREVSAAAETKIDLLSIIRDLIRDGWMIVTAGLMAVMCAYMLLSVTYTPRYTSSATLIVSAKGATNAAASDLSVTTNQAENLSMVLESEIVRKKVQEELGLSYFPGEIQASVIPETNMLTLKVTAGSPETAFELIRSLLNHYSEVTDYAMSSVVLNVLDAPSVPMAPSNPLQAQSVLKKAFLAGAFLMAAALVLLSYFRDTVKNEKEVERKLDTGLFATVYHEKKYKTIRQSAKARMNKKKKSVTIDDPTMSFLFVETFKKIRTKLMYRMEKEEGKVILVTSVMENEGKSTVAANIALALAQKSSKVLLVDGDLRRPAVHKILGMKVQPRQEIGSFLAGRQDMNQVLIADKDRKVFVIGGTRKYPNSTEIVSGEKMKRLLSASRKVMDYVIIDSPPMSLMADAEVLAEYADFSLLVVKQGVARVRDINDSIDVLERGHSHLLGCIYNDVRTGIFSGRKSWGYGYDGYGRYRKYGYGSYYRYGYGPGESGETTDAGSVPELK